MSTGVHGPTRASIEEKTLRTDRWWLYPLTVFVVFTAFVIYATIRAFSGSNYYQAPYLSPFYSPCLGDCVSGSSDFGQPFGWWPLSASLLVLIFPLGFRMSCYYYRKAYYRSFWMSPPACAVAEPHTAYSGETRLPLILNNIHRYFWYAAVIVGLILTWDTILAFGPAEGESDGIHMGLGLADLPRQHRADLDVHAVVPLVPPHRRRPAPTLLQAPGPLPGLDLGLQDQPPPRPLRVALPVLGRVRRPLRAPDLLGSLQRPEVLLMSESATTCPWRTVTR